MENSSGTPHIAVFVYGFGGYLVPSTNKLSPGCPVSCQTIIAL